MIDDEELVKEFLVESHEYLDQLDQDLVTLEGDPTNPEMLSRIFRTFHTIKGTCGFLGYTKLEWVTHVGENLLSRMRDREITLNAEITTALLSLVDAVRQILDSIENSREEGDADYQPLVDKLTHLHDTGGSATDEAAPSSEPAAPVTTPDPLRTQQASADATLSGADQSTPADASSEPEPSDQEAAESATSSDESGDGLDQRLQQFLVESYEHADQLDQDLVALESDPTNRAMLSRIVGSLHTLKSSSGFLGFKATESAVHEGESLLTAMRDGELQFSSEIATALLSLVDMVRQALVAIETAGNEREIDYESLIAILKRLQVRTKEVATPAPSAPAKPKSTSSAARSQSVADTSIRVDVGLLDRLMDQVGELVLARNRIMQFATLQEDRSVIAAYQRLDLITSELQEDVMKTRMQPIGTIWNKFPRVVRDLARDCGKEVNLTMEGEETELDRTLIEAIRDPLTHLVRNAVDHGIESPEARTQAGKPAAGGLSLRAFHEGGQVNIAIADDGGGIDPKRILARAIDRDLISEAQAAQSSDREILDLIFAPGFSTAETVTNVSGRGVGMDVVRNNIDKINGTIDIHSEVGMGSTINIKIPLTLAIIPALIVRTSGDRYAIPQASLIELLRLEGDAEQRIETIHGTPVYRLRGKLLPLVYLHDELNVEPIAADDFSGDETSVTNIVVLQADQRQFGLVVESVLDTEEIVVKPLGKQLKDIAVYAGATIMGDGKVALILDVPGLAEHADVVSGQRDTLAGDAESKAVSVDGNFQTLLLFESSSGQRMTLPLARVTRLEKFPRAKIEHSGECEVIQYWGDIMPLIRVSDFLDGSAARPTSTESDDTVDVVVMSAQSTSIGLVVDRILDTVEGAFEVQPLSSRPGVMGTVVVQGQVAELLDLDELIRAAGPSLFAHVSSATNED